MKWLERILIPAALAIGLVAMTCTVNTTGAPCETRANCPSGQFCSIENTCHSYQQNAPCETDDHCPEGEHCLAGNCAEGTPPADAGIDAGPDAGSDAGADAGQIDCAINDNCKTEHVVEGQCVEGRCVVACEDGWEDANHNVVKDGCEKEIPCGSASQLVELGFECETTAKCKCGKSGSHCVKGLAEGMGFGTDKGVCLEDCPAGDCGDSRYKCVPTKVDENMKPVVQSCFKIGKLTGAITILVKNVCEDVAGDGRAGLARIALDFYNAEFTVFTACRDKSSNPPVVVVQGFRFCNGPTTPCPDILYMYIREDAFGASAEIPYFNERNEPTFGATYLYATIEQDSITEMTIRGMASGGRIFNIVNTTVAEYKAELDIELIKYEITFCGAETGKECPKFNQ
ncbi:MAG: hypothetical protein HY897_05285 [Deltaproteobacteria bacterium]|nr:hypothetical protein [Deltaproteobacteria bacterium]